MSKFAPLSSLGIADHPSWHSLPGYCPQVGLSLTQAYAALEQEAGNYEGYYQAYLAVHPYRGGQYRDGPLCPVQRLNVEYVLAKAYAGTNDVSLAQYRIESALESASYLGEQASQMQLFQLAGVLNISQNQLAEGVRNYSTALNILQEIEGRNEAPVPDNKIDLLTRLAAANDGLGRQDIATSQLEVADTIYKATPALSTARLGTIRWLKALFQQGAGNLHEAVSTAEDAAEIISHSDSPIALGRIEIVVADLALQIADTFATDGLIRRQVAYTQLAELYIQRAAEALRDTQDVIGRNLARLTKVHLQRLTGIKQDRIAQIERILHYAKYEQEAALLGRAYMALGNEYEAQGEFTSASGLYASAYDVLSEYGLHSMALQAYQALRRIEDIYN